ncbi:MAG: hypothetical protein PHZ02_04030 [Desulfocapsaceae bacterium]|nr:hypothetical protein [Desulfocapsaceae bacterium]
MLLLTEGKTENWFQTLSLTLDTNRQCKITEKWSVADRGGKDSLIVFRNDAPEREIHIVAGRQVVTMENIEVLALFVKQGLTNGLSLHETVDRVKELGGIPVLPWGAGKWFGKRGEIIKNFLVNHGDSNLFLGDNGGRPRFWPTPDLFRLAQKTGFVVLPGSDPLPLPSEALRVGSFGFYLHANNLHGGSPTKYLKKALLSPKVTISPFGCLQKNRLFFLNQLRLRHHS